MKTLTFSEFQELERKHPYYSGRWDYFKIAVEFARKSQAENVLELGPSIKPIVAGSDLMDFDPFFAVPHADRTFIQWIMLHFFRLTAFFRGKPFFKGMTGFLMSFFPQDLTYLWDARNTPWPIEDKKYDLFIALQVWEHLGDKQGDAFREVMRISRMAILSFPLGWNCPGDCHHNITKEKISEWTLNMKPDEIRKADGKLAYFFRFTQ